MGLLCPMYVQYRHTLVEVCSQPAVCCLSLLSIFLSHYRLFSFGQYNAGDQVSNSLPVLAKTRNHRTLHVVISTS